MSPGPERRVLVAVAGARRHYAIPLAFAALDRLEWFHTDFYLDRNGWLAGMLGWLNSVMPSAIVRRALDRCAAGLPASRVRWNALAAVVDALKRNGAWFGSGTSGYQAARAARFGQAVVRAGFGNAAIVYGANGASVEIFRAARERGLWTVLDQTSMSCQSDAELIDHERRVWPGWDPDETAEASYRVLADREREEWNLADRIVCGSACVAGDLVARGVSRDKCVVVPSGFDQEAGVTTRIRKRGSDSFRLLFVGQVGLRKGVPYLLEALRRVSGTGIACRLVGPVGIAAAALDRYGNVAEVKGPVPRSRIVDHYDWADCLVLPTLSEGSAMATYEAMAAGLPVITTANAGSVVRDGLDGVIVPPASSEAVELAIRRLRADPGACDRMGESARRRVGEYTVAAYRRRLLEVVR